MLVWTASACFLATAAAAIDDAEEGRFGVDELDDRLMGRATDDDDRLLDDGVTEGARRFLATGGGAMAPEFLERAFTDWRQLEY
jgi:hypothetical protein